MELLWRILAFEKPWDVFVRKAFGCELRGETTPETCEITRSEIDYAKFRQSCEAARQLFKFKETCQ